MNHLKREAQSADSPNHVTHKLQKNETVIFGGILYEIGEICQRNLYYNHINSILVGYKFDHVSYLVMQSDFDLFWGD